MEIEIFAFEMRAYLVTYAPVTVDLFTGMSAYNIGYIDQMYPAGKCGGSRKNKQATVHNEEQLVTE